MTEQPTLFRLEPREHARNSDPDTSHAAAARLSDHRTMMRLLLAAYAAADRTCEEAAVVAGFDPEKSSKRVSDLTRLGFLEDTGRRRYGSAGRLQAIKRITPAGRAALRGEAAS